jgi:murein DD-endopeptidase MepM/ murein hydrolase activator NlpD
MPMLPLNSTYSAPPASPKSVDVGRFAGLAKNIAASQQPSPAPQPPAPQPSPAPLQPATPSAPPYDASGLGNVTTEPGEPTKWESSHPGLDIAGPENQEVPAFQPGTVTDVKNGVPHGANNGFGNYVTVTDRYGVRHRYSHLNKAWVRLGE